VESITFGANIKTIYENNFFDCLNLKSITFNGTVEEWRQIFKYSSWYRGPKPMQVVCSDGTVDLK
jgi:hypothetical protein